MAAINDDVYARVREKVKEHNLTEQEVKAIDTARDQLQTHSKQSQHAIAIFDNQLNLLFSI
jgi:hypothetical protein